MFSPWVTEHSRGAGTGRRVAAVTSLALHSRSRGPGLSSAWFTGRRWSCGGSSRTGPGVRLPGHALPTQLRAAGLARGTPGSHTQTAHCHAVGLRTDEAHEETRLKVSGDPGGLHARIHSLGRSLADYGAPALEWAPRLQVQMEQTARGLKAGCRGAGAVGSSGGRRDREALRGRLARRARAAGGLGRLSGSSSLSCALACHCLSRTHLASGAGGESEQ